MRILVVNELLKYGGSEVQSKREVKNLKAHGHEAVLLTLDPNFEEGYITDECYNIKHSESVLLKFIHFAVLDKKLLKKIEYFISSFQPDFIHLNNANRYALPIYRALDNYDCIQTIRDYGAVCPTALSICANKEMCEGYRSMFDCCKKCVILRPRKIKTFLQILRFQQRTKVRKKTIKGFVCPSQMLTDYCNRFGLNTVCINNPFDFQMLDAMQLPREKNFEKKVFLYYGLIAEHKGIVQLLDAFETFATNKTDVQLLLVGDTTPDFKMKFGERLARADEEKIKYVGKLDYEAMIKTLSSVYTVVVPSLWIENYPNTVLEAMSCGCLVIASERGGMREMICDDRFIFRILDSNDIIDKLEIAYCLSKEEYMRITAMAMKRVRENNSFQQYYDKLMDRIWEYKL